MTRSCVSNAGRGRFSHKRITVLTQHHRLNFRIGKPGSNGLGQSEAFHHPGRREHRCASPAVKHRFPERSPLHGRPAAPLPGIPAHVLRQTLGRLAERRDHLPRPGNAQAHDYQRTRGELGFVRQFRSSASTRCGCVRVFMKRRRQRAHAPRLPYRETWLQVTDRMVYPGKRDFQATRSVSNSPRTRASIVTCSTAPVLAANRAE